MVAGVAAAFAVDNAGIAGLVAVKAEGVELFDHLALGDVLIQTAVGIGTGILGVLLGQGREALLGLVAGLVLGEDFLGLGLGGFLGLVGVVAVGVGLGLHQDVADIRGLVVVVVTGEEDHHIAAAGVGIDGHVALLAGGVVHPVGGGNAAALNMGLLAAGLPFGGGGIDKAHGGAVALGYLVGVRNGAGFGGRGGDGLIGHVTGGVAVGVGGFHALGGNIAIGVVIVILRAFVALVLLLQLLIRVGEAVAQGLGGLACQHGGLISRADQPGVDAGAVVRGQHVVAAGVAVGPGLLLEAVKSAVDLRVIFIIKGEALLGGVLAQNGLMGQLMLGGVQEIILPGAVFILHHGAGLLVKAADAVGGVQTEDAGILAVLVGKSIILVCVAVVHFGDIVVFAAHGERGRLVDNAGVEHQHKHDHQHDSDGADRPAEIIFGFFFRFLFQGEGLLVSAGFAGGLTVLSFG